jgi:hypothetical protein
LDSRSAIKSNVGMYLRCLLFVPHVLHRDFCDIGLYQAAMRSWFRAERGPSPCRPPHIASTAICSGRSRSIERVVREAILQISSPAMECAIAMAVAATDRVLES